MNKKLVKIWENNKKVIVKTIIDKYIKQLWNLEYKDIVNILFNYIYESGNAIVNEIDLGDYQGDYLYVIADKEDYQPSPIFDYIFITTVDYGSCSGCDTLKSIISAFQTNEVNLATLRQNIESLCMHLIQKTKLLSEVFYDSELGIMDHKKEEEKF